MASKNVPEGTGKVYLDPVEKMAEAAYDRFSYDDPDAKKWDDMVFNDRYLWRQIARAVMAAAPKNS